MHRTLYFQSDLLHQPLFLTGLWWSITRTPESKGEKKNSSSDAKSCFSLAEFFFLVHSPSAE
jgi:hypothetical protein